MHIEKAMQGDTIEIRLRITKMDDLYTVSMNNDEGGLAMISAEEVDTLSVSEILRCLYDAAYGAENPRFDTSETLTAADRSTSEKWGVTPLSEGCGDD